MIEEREYMLKVIWKTIDPERHLLHTFRDGTKCFFLKGLKIERDEDTYQLYDTGITAYKVMSDSAVWYAYNEGIHKLSVSLSRTKAEHRLKGTRSKYQVTDATIKMFEKIIRDADIANIPNLNQIKEDYESKQREDRQAIQEV